MYLSINQSANLEESEMAQTIKTILIKTANIGSNLNISPAKIKREKGVRIILKAKTIVLK